MRKSSFVLVLLIVSFCLFSATMQVDPSWVFLQRAQNLMSTGEYSDAMTEVRKAKSRRVEELLQAYWDEIYQKHPEKTDYELKKMLKEKEFKLKRSDNYPAYHELMGDLFVATNFLEEAESEYKIALSQKNFFDYPDQAIEIQYKLATLYSLRVDVNIEEMVYREILVNFFKLKSEDYWNRIRYNIRKDITLSHLFKVYRIDDGMKFFKALTSIGKKEAIAQRHNESFFYLGCATVVWMTYYAEQIKRNHPDFQFNNPAQFINYINNEAYPSEYFPKLEIDKVMFYIGYNYFLMKEYNLMEHYFELSSTFAKKSGRFVMVNDLINFLKSNKDHVLTYEELLN